MAQTKAQTSAAAQKAAAICEAAGEAKRAAGR
jgi:hypothetical protein